MRRMSHTETNPTAVLELRSQSEAETIAFGRRLGAQLAAGDVVLLFAPFGAGKTHLTKGIAAAFGVDEAEVNSPSFVLINQYEADRAHGRMPIFHVDLYRIDTPAALASVGLDEVLSDDALAIIEWAERGADWFPREHLRIEMAHLGDSTRRIRLMPHGARAEQIVAALRATA